MLRYLTLSVVILIFTESMCVVPEDIVTQEKKDERTSPVILSYTPVTHVITEFLADNDPEITLEFKVEGIDPDGDDISYKWETLVCEGSVCSYSIYPENINKYRYPAQLPQKDVFVGVELSDGINNVYHYWIVRIQRKVF